MYPSSNAVAVKDPSEDKPLKLYVRLSAWLVPSFLVCAIIGLTALSKFVVADVDRNLSMRIGNFAARVASGIEMIALDTDDPIPASQQLLLTLMSDPAVECAELRDIDGTPLVKAPQNLGCYEGVSPRFLTVPLYLTDEADLVVHWNREEVSTARQRQWELSLIILFAGLMIAMLTNWLAFRTIIGRPLTNLVQKVEDAKRKAEYNALHDSLTNLANRRQLDYELERRGAQRQALTILHIDLDGFKTINDTLGHGAGDEILKVVSERLKDTAWVDEITGRYGGDEFVVILPPGETTEAGETRATQIIDSIMEEIIVDGQACQVGASIGIASGNPNGRPDQASRILANADIALYRAKDKGRGVYVVYSSEMREEMEMRNRLADELETALEQREFVPFYQPQVEADGHKTIGFEALARWEHPKHGLLAPDRFISAAEDMGLVDKIDRIIFEKVLEDRANWLAQGLNVPRIAVNVSARRLYNKSLLDEVRAFNVEPGTITFEVLESVVIDRSNPTLIWNIDGLRELGIQIDIDDFGTGRASIASVLAIQPSRIKVAREIIQAGHNDDMMIEMLRTIVAFGRSVNVELVAEGVETTEQSNAVANLGFDVIQGYAIARPLPAASVLDWLSDQVSEAS